MRTPLPDVLAHSPGAFVGAEHCPLVGARAQATPVNLAGDAAGERRDGRNFFDYLCIYSLVAEDSR
jgi:hypothetical protein